MLEALFRIIFEVVLAGLLRLIGRIGYWITRALVALAVGRRIFVAPPPGNLIVVTRWHGLHRLTDGTPVIGQRLASLLGLVLLTVTIFGLVLLFKSMRS